MALRAGFPLALLRVCVFLNQRALKRHPERRPLRPESKDPGASMHAIAIPPESSRRLLIAAPRARITPMRTFRVHRREPLARDLGWRDQRPRAAHCAASGESDRGFLVRYNVTRLVYFEQSDR
ncbi:MAG: hypothetical protein WA854_00950, partial [Candidatus Binataceae bacterium]